jgi:glycosidase
MILRLREIHQGYSLSKSVRYFHVSKEARGKYDFEEELFSQTGILIVANFAASRRLAARINKKRTEEKLTDKFVTPGQINALGILHELIHLVLRNYEQIQNPGVFSRTVNHLSEMLGGEEFTKVLEKFVEIFPPLSVYKNKVTVKEYLQGFTEEKANKEIVIEELIILHLENLNPAFDSLKEMFNSEPLEKDTQYKVLIKETKTFFQNEEPADFFGISLIDALESAILSNPYQIVEQLKSFKVFWPLDIEFPLEDLVLLGTDLLKEDSRLFQGGAGAGGKGTPPVPKYDFNKEYASKLKEAIKKGGKPPIDFDDVELSFMVEEEKFTEDIDWMPNVVMIAKNSLVWLDQLSKKYSRKIDTLDKIPDEELDQLQRWNFNALWLIGVWERSDASAKIKQFCGNPEAASSAYSLFDYDIAFSLGGESAYENLRDRCNARNIRLASDMVPNHTGIYSRWIIDHPEYFIQAQEPPYPNYTFTGPNLSDNNDIELRIEDRYYTRQDAAVVFQHIDKRSGKIRYIYHGNDGTNMPWNDTAQLNLLDPVVREELIKTIQKVARKFSIIRFDAAMILSKKHYQRLWFPQPGAGGAVPSRSDYAISKQTFHKMMPKEFWREVVDRFNEEMPNTLLLAEAFWLMEGYFVRSLGMHRVYNSAFMHMFMKEENDKYRKLIKNTIEFDPEILKRYVNFMSNPDEETAVNQFGKGDKYFGICVMMATLPGLPMFAHGQIEGFTEKYGMEYRRAYYDEIPDGYLIDRHLKEIFPLLKKRYLFSNVKNFELFDFYDDFKNLNENVIAFSNRVGDEKALVFFNNSFFRATGNVRYASGKRVKTQYIDGNNAEDNWEASNVEDQKVSPNELEYKSLSQALQLKRYDNYYYTYKDMVSGQEFIKPGRDFDDDGYFISLNGYEFHVLVGFKEVFDTDGSYYRLNQFLHGQGTPSLSLTLLELNLINVHHAVLEFFNKDILLELKKFAGLLADPEPINDFSATFTQRFCNILNEIGDYKKVHFNNNTVLTALKRDLLVLKSYSNYITNISEGVKGVARPDNYWLIGTKENRSIYSDILVLYAIVKRILITIEEKTGENPVELYDSLLLEKALWQSLIRLGDKYHEAKYEFDLLRILESSENVYKRKGIFNPDGKNETLEEELPTITLIKKKEVQAFIGVNDYHGVKYFSKEQFVQLMTWIYTLNGLRHADRVARKNPDKSKDTVAIFKLYKSKEFTSAIKTMATYIDGLIDNAVHNGFRLAPFLQAIPKIHDDLYLGKPETPKVKKPIAKVAKVAKTVKAKVKTVKKAKPAVKKTKKTKTATATKKKPVLKKVVKVINDK